MKLEQSMIKPPVSLLLILIILLECFYNGIYDTNLKLSSKSTRLDFSSDSTFYSGSMCLFCSALFTSSTVTSVAHEITHTRSHTHKHPHSICQCALRPSMWGQIICLFTCVFNAHSDLFRSLSPCVLTLLHVCRDKRLPRI